MLPGVIIKDERYHALYDISPLVFYHIVPFL